eukprot:2382836-Alexandrium_andersonii.AAC.1
MRAAAPDAPAPSAIKVPLSLGPPRRGGPTHPSSPGSPAPGRPSPIRQLSKHSTSAQPHL